MKNIEVVYLSFMFYGRCTLGGYVDAVRVGDKDKTWWATLSN